MKLYLSLILTLFIVFILTAYRSETVNNDNTENENQVGNSDENNNEEDQENILTLGDTFEFDNLELTFGTEVN